MIVVLEMSFATTDRNTILVCKINFTNTIVFVRLIQLIHTKVEAEVIKIKFVVQRDEMYPELMFYKYNTSVN